MSVVIGTLVIDLKANTSTFTQSMDKMSSLSGKTSNDVKRSLERIAAAGIAMGLAVATGTAALIRSALNAADRLDELAESAGTTTETLSALGYAAKFSSVDTETLSKMLEKLSKSALAAQGGNEGLRRVFKALGVDVESSKGHLKDSGVLFEELAPAFSKMADGAGKTGIALQLLGKSGAASIPILNQLGETQGRLTKEAKEFGIVIGTDTARAAGEVNDNLDRLKAVITGVGNSLLATTLPALLTLSDHLVRVAKEANIPDLGKAFGGTVTAAIEKVGTALEFAVKHAHELKIAIEALLALQVAKFAIPFGLEVLASGTLLAGVGKLTTSLLGIGKLYPTLAKFSAWVALTSSDLLFFAANEGIAATATYYLGGAIAVLTAPITIVIGAIAALSAGMYYFRDSTFHAGGEVYKLRDAYLALWQILTWQNKGEGSWSGNLARVKKEREAAEKAAATPAAAPSLPHFRPPPTADTGDIAVPKKDVYGEEIKKLDLAIAAQQAYLAVIGASPEKILAAASAERAEGIILEKNTSLLDEHRAKLTKKQEATIRDKVAIEDATKAMVDYGRSIIGEQQSTDLSIRQQTALAGVVSQSEEAIRKAGVENAILGLTYGKTFLEVEAMAGELKKLAGLLAQKADTEGLAAFAKTIDDQRRSLVLSTAQTEALAAAQLRGEGAVREATAANATLALTYGKTAEEVRKLKLETDNLAESLKKKAAADRLDAANAALFGLQQDLASRAGLPAAILQGEDAYRKAALAARLFGIDQKILAEDNDLVRQSLIKQRQAIIDTTKAELAESDAREALALRSTGDKYREETDALRRQVDALTDGGKRALTYGEAQQVAAKQQELLNKAIDEQVTSLTRAGGAQDGVAAFFLNMEKQAKSTASIVYDALNSAFDKLSDNITDLLIGTKTNFAQAFKEIGKQIVGDTVKSSLQRSLGAVGHALGIEIPKGKPDGTEDNPLWIRMKRVASIAGSTDDGAGQLKDAVSQALKGKFGGDSGGMIFHSNDPAKGPSPGIWATLLSSLLGAGIGAAAGGHGGGGGGESVTSSISYPTEGRAGGGPVSPDAAYIVGEHGREILNGASGRVINNAQTERMLRPSGSTHYYNIDARGTDPVLTEQRTRTAIMAAHNSAVGTGFQVQQEHMKRTPHR